MTGPAFQREQAPFLMRCALGAVMEGVIGPLARGIEKFGRGERIFRGMHAQQLKAMAKHPPFGSYQVLQHDVIVAAYVKSGTNWMMQIAHQLLNHGKGEFGHIHEVVPWPECRLMPPMRKYAVPVEDESAWRASPEQKRVIKTHLPWEMLPYSPEARYIVVIRDPKDVFVSGYYFFGNGIGRGMPSVEAWLRLFLSDDFMSGSWAAHAAGYWAERQRPNLLLLSFKAIKRDLRGTVHRVAEFLGVHPASEVFEAVCERSSFEYMQRNSSKFDLWPMIPWRPATKMIRKGAQGGSSELLNSEQQRRIDAYFQHELKRLGSDLPYEAFADLAATVQQSLSA